MGVKIVPWVELQLKWESLPKEKTWPVQEVMKGLVEMVEERQEFREYSSGAGAVRSGRERGKMEWKRDREWEGR